MTIRTKKEELSYSDVLKKAREKISLNELGIEETRIRRGINGGVIIEIPEEKQGTDKANRLAEKLKEVFKGEDVAIARPTASAEIRIIGIDDSTTKEEVKYTIAYIGVSGR